MSKISFALGDVVEFRDMVFKGNREAEFTDEIYVERINSVYIEMDLNLVVKDIELWGMIYSEMPGRMFFRPHAVIRIIEKSKNKDIEIPNRVFPKGKRAIYKDTVDNKQKSFVDEIESYIYRVSSNESSGWQFKLKESGHVIDEEELEFI